MKILSSRYIVLISTSLLLVIPPLIGDVYLLSFLILILMYIVISSSWNILGGFTGYNSFGHGVFFGIGAYVTALIISSFGMPMLAIPLGGFVASILAVLTGYPCLRLKGIYFALATYPINVVFKLLIELLPFTGGPLGIMLKPIFKFDPLTTEIIFYELFLIVALMTVLFSYKILHSKVGIGLISIREDEEAARSFGVPATKLKLLAYAMSALPIAIVGGLFAVYNLYINPGTVFAFTLSLYAIGTNYLGGMGTVLGPVFGSTVFVFLSEYIRFGLGVTVEGLPMVIFGMSLMFVMLFMPKGILWWLKRFFLLIRAGS